MGAWGTRWLPANEAPRGQFLEAGGPPLWERFRAELRQEHLECGLPPGARPCAPRWKQPIRGSLQVRQTTRQRGRSPPGDAVTAPFSWRKWTNEALEQYTMPVSPALRRRLASFALCGLTTLTAAPTAVAQWPPPWRVLPAGAIAGLLNAQGYDRAPSAVPRGLSGRCPL